MYQIACQRSEIVWSMCGVRVYNRTSCLCTLKSLKLSHFNAVKLAVKVKTLELGLFKFICLSNYWSIKPESLWRLFLHGICTGSSSIRASSSATNDVCGRRSFQSFRHRAFTLSFLSAGEKQAGAHHLSPSASSAQAWHCQLEGTVHIFGHETQTQIGTIFCV